MLPISIDILGSSWGRCSGYTDHYASEHIENYITIPADGFESSKGTLITAPKLKNSLFGEAQHYLDRAIYQICLSKRNFCEGAASWGLVGFYYSSFFSVQAALRLTGRLFVKVTYTLDNPPPTHEITVVNLVTDRYSVRRCGPKQGEHHRVWKAYYETLSSIANLPKYFKYQSILNQIEPEDRLAEMHARHLVNYVPGQGYYELESRRRQESFAQLLQSDVFEDQSRSIEDIHQLMELRAVLRIELCLQLLVEIARSQGSIYSKKHSEICSKRIDLLDRFNCPNYLKNRLVSAIQKQPD